MKDEILNVIQNNPGIRKRYIASELNCWVGDLLKPMSELEKDGLITHTTHNDPCNLEYYDQYYAK